jgi:hypothetical protein
VICIPMRAGARRRLRLTGGQLSGRTRGLWTEADSLPESAGATGAFSKRPRRNCDRPPGPGQLGGGQPSQRLGSIGVHLSVVGPRPAIWCRRGRKASHTVDRAGSPWHASLLRCPWGSVGAPGEVSEAVPPFGNPTQRRRGDNRCHGSSLLRFPGQPPARQQREARALLLR